VLRSSGLERTAEETVEYWINVGSIYLCFSYSIFTAGSTLCEFMRQQHAEKLRLDPSTLHYHLSYLNLYENLAKLIGITFLTFVFLFYVIQNKYLRDILVEMLSIVVTGHTPAERREQRLNEQAEVAARGQHNQENEPQQNEENGPQQNEGRGE